MKVLILEACLVIALGQELAAHADVGEVVDMSKDDATSLARQGRALFMSRDDDPTKGSLTAQEDDKKRVAKQAEAIKVSQKQIAATTQPTDFAGMLERGIAAGIAQGMAAIQAAQQPAPAGNGKT